MIELDSTTVVGGISAALLLVAEVLFQITVVGMIVLRRGTAHAVRLAWILVVLILPLFGGLAYLRFGRVRPRRLALRRRVRLQVDAVADSEQRPVGDRIEIKNPELAKGERLVRRIGGMPPAGGNRVHLYGTRLDLDDCTEAIRRLIADIEEAQSTCHLLFYIYLDDSTGQRVGNALTEAAGRGVTCRLMVDAVGSRPFLRSKSCKRLREAGVEVLAAQPIHPLSMLLSRFDHRNHRKIAIIDGRIGWTGSQNIADASFAVKARYAPWIDVMVRLEGPAVHDLQRVFTEDWLLERGGTPGDILTPRPSPFEDGIVVQILPSGPGLAAGGMKQLSLLAFLETDQELIITTPYFVPDEATAEALLTVARAGVHTALVVPKRNDSRLVSAASRAYYDEMLDAGVEIYEYRRGLLHAKTFTFDRMISVVATANLDRRSYELNWEISMVMASPVFTQRLRELQLSYIHDSDLIDPTEWRRRPASSRILQNSANLLAPLL